jgi:hypothetical protein
MIVHPVRCREPAVVLCVLVLLWGLEAMGSRAQPVGKSGSERETLRAKVLHSRGTVASGRPAEASSSDRFGRALGGSTLGVAAGTGLGLLLWQAAAEEGLGTDRPDRLWRDEPDAALVLFGMGLLAIGAGGPIGAVEGSGLEERRTDAYVAATVGEGVLGGLGYGLVHELNGGTAERLAGLGIGAALGAAAGTALVASQAAQGAVAYRDSTWHLAPSGIRVRPALASNQSPSIRVTLVSVRL